MAQKRKKCANTSIVCLFHLAVLSTFAHTQKSISIWAYQGLTLSVCSFPMKMRKRLACDIFDTSATHGYLVISLIQTAGHKIAALMVMLSWLLNIGFEQRGPEIPIDGACDASLVQLSKPSCRSKGLHSCWGPVHRQGSRGQSVSNRSRAAFPEWVHGTAGFWQPVPVCSGHHQCLK